MDRAEKIDYIAQHDPEGSEKLKKLLARTANLKEGNVYGERFTDRQFNLVFNPILETCFARAQVLEALSEGENTVVGLAEKLKTDPDEIFRQVKELVRRNQAETAGHRERDPLYRKKI